VSTTIPISPRASPIGLPALRASSTDELLVRLLQSAREPVQQPRPVAGREVAPAGNGRLRPRDGGVGLLDARSGHLLEHRLGGGLEDLQRVAHSRSNPRTRSQSVTAAWNAFSSTSAMLR
jgi:hypothetical protein